MRRSSPARPVVLALALSMVTSSCALFSVPNDVGVKNVGVDLTFGGSAPTSPEPLPDFTLAPIPTITLPEPPEPEDPPPPPPPLCGPTTATAPRDAAVATMHADRHMPQPGDYPFRYTGNFENQPPFAGDANKTISNVQRFGFDGGFDFDITDAVPGMRLAFRSLPLTESGQLQAGLYLRFLEIPQRDETTGSVRMLLFEPRQPLQLVAFPIQPGATITRSAPDVSPKSEAPVTDPLTGGPVLLPSANEITSRLRIDVPERIIVCEELAQAYRSAWDLQITGEFNLRILGNFWLATQYGGWPVKDDYVVVGDLIPGNFASNLLKLDPGDWV